MFNWYKTITLPWLINSAMGSKDLEKIRNDVLGGAFGIVLEIGAGPGYNFPFYKNITKLYALEPSQELIKIAQTRTSQLFFPIEFINAGAETIPLPDQSVDTVVSTWTLCSVNNPTQVLNEIRRVLKPQGKFIFVDHGASPNAGIKFIQTIFTGLTKHFTGNCHYDRVLDSLISDAGFKIKDLTHPKEKFRPLIYNYQGTAIPKSH